ncbi:hypothetical protein BJ165DRAFT_1514864, partial [Panaeolus papilionaceus]
MRNESSVGVLIFCCGVEKMGAMIFDRKEEGVAKLHDEKRGIRSETYEGGRGEDM